MSPGPTVDPRQLEEEPGLDVGTEPGAGLGGYPGMDGDIRIISREIYQGKTFDDWDDMEANVRRLARKAGFKVVKVSKNTDDRLSQVVAVCVVPCASAALLDPAPPSPPCALTKKQLSSCWLAMVYVQSMLLGVFFASDPPTAQRTRVASRAPPRPCCCFGAAPDICFFFLPPKIGDENQELIRSRAATPQAVHRSHHIGRESHHHAFSLCWLLVVDRT